MSEQSLKSGTCPKCGSKEIYTNRELPKRGDRMQLVISSGRWYFLDTYICTNCFYFEEYVPEKEKSDDAIMAKIKDSWKKVE